LRHAFITAALDAGVPLRDVQETARPDPRHYGTPPRRAPDPPSGHSVRE
jgi:hypothetical protein